MRGRTDIYRRMLQGFVRDSAADRAALAHALDAGDAEGVRRRMHTLKGVAATLGLDALAAAAAQAETQASDAPAVLRLWDDSLAPAQALVDALGTDDAAEMAAASAPAQTPPQDGKAGGDALRRLMAMLDAADMAATDAVQALGPLLPASRQADVATLQDAVMGLDFERARALCQALLDGEADIATR